MIIVYRYMYIHVGIQHNVQEVVRPMYWRGEWSLAHVLSWNLTKFLML